MYPHSISDHQNKENLGCVSKPLSHFPTSRTFGMDITAQLLSSLDLDQQDSNDPFRLGVYAKEIYEYLHSTQHRFQPVHGYMQFQTDISERMRAILIDWLIEVHFKFRLSAETLHLTVNVLDRYLQSNRIERTALQLIGSTAMLIASKYEDIHPPTTQELVFIMDHTYTLNEVLRMENRVLSTLNFNLTVVTPNRLLERYAKVLGFTEKEYFLAQFFIETSLLDYRLIKYSPAVLAGTAGVLVNKAFQKVVVWPNLMIEHTGLTESHLVQCEREILHSIQVIDKIGLKTVRKKFSQDKFLGVGRFSTTN